MKEHSEFGIIGLGVMGKSLALNLAEKGFSLSLFNRHEAGVEEDIALKFIKSDPLLRSAKGFDELKSFVASLSAPRKVLIMIKAGPAIDKIIESMIPILDSGDILIDGGNSHYKDTRRRMDYLESKNMHFIGCGVSGGEEGARKGPSIMPGGSENAYAYVNKYLETIAARDKSGNGCCAFIGKEGAGHFVKMVHNGIEYAEMQLIAEAYGLLRFGGGLSPDEVSEIFESWMTEGLGSYLLEITISILKTKEKEGWLIDKILDKAGNKGTGSWTTIAAAELGVPVTLITAALFARYTSSFKMERVENSKVYNFQNNNISKGINKEELKNAYQIARIINHHQGFHLLQAASITYDWHLNFSAIARIWTNGCIIRSTLMEQLIEPLKSEIRILNMRKIIPLVKENKTALAQVLKTGIEMAQETPCFSAAFNYLLAYTAEQSTANIIQAQRDYFGAHTFQRNDIGSGQFYHHIW